MTRGILADRQLLGAPVKTQDWVRTENPKPLCARLFFKRKLFISSPPLRSV